MSFSSEVGSGAPAEIEFGATSDGNNFNYFSENKLTTLANLVQFKHMLLFCSENWGAWAP